VGIIVPIISGFAALITGGLAAWFGEVLKHPEAKRKTETLRARAEKLNLSLKEAVTLISEMQNEVQLNQELVVKLRTDVERYDKLAKRAEKLNSSLQNAVTLINEMQDEVQLNQELVAKLRTDVERYDNLAKLEEEEVESVVQVLRSELQREGRKSFWQGVGINFFFFVLGSVVTAAITLTLT